jgi:hypothetical protein
MPAIVLSEKIYKRLQKYATSTGEIPDDVAERALNRWMDSTGHDLTWILEKDRKAQQIQKNSSPPK